MDVKDIIKRYGAKLEKESGEEFESNYTRAYSKFKEEVVPTLSLYERMCSIVRG